MQMRTLLCTPRIAGGGDFVKSYSLIISPTTLVLVPCLSTAGFDLYFPTLPLNSLRSQTRKNTLLQGDLGSETGMSKRFV